MTALSALGQATREVFEPFARTQDASGPAWDPGLWHQVDLHGFGLVGVPEHMGGAGGNFDASSDVVRAAGALALPLPLPEGLVGQWALVQAGLPARPGPVTLALEPPAARGSLLRREPGGWRLATTLTRTPWARRARCVVVAATDPADRVPVVARLDPSSLRIREGRNAAGEERDDVEAGARCLQPIALPAAGPGLEDVRRRLRLLEACRLLAAAEELARRALATGAPDARRSRGLAAAELAAPAIDLTLAGAALDHAVALRNDADAALAGTVRHVARVARAVLAACGGPARRGRLYRVARCWLQELLATDGAVPAVTARRGQPMIRHLDSSEA